jgi:hypothetical protein
VTTRRKRQPEPAVAPSGNLVRTATWAGLHKGDAVEVSDTRIRSASWQFVAHVRNVASGDEWIEVVGGGSGDRKLRSFPPSRVFAPTKKSRRKDPPVSLADAPRLPLE